MTPHLTAPTTPTTPTTPTAVAAPPATSLRTPDGTHHQRDLVALADRYATLHREARERSRPFVIPNPWDVGTARLLEHLGFDALATTGAGYAFSRGVPDGRTDPEALLDHAGEIAAATTLPVTADLEDGFGDDPSAVAATIRAAAARGLVAASIEDRSYGRRSSVAAGTMYEVEHATDRIRAAVEAARGAPFPFSVTARCECFLVGRPDLGETIRRLQAYQEAGADVLYAPGLATADAIAAVTSSVDRPVNVVMGLVPSELTLDDLGRLGVARVSLGSALARIALGAVLRAVDRIRSTGTFDVTDDGIPYREITKLLA